MLGGGRCGFIDDFAQPYTRRYGYLPTYMIHGLTEPHLEFS